MLQIYYKFRKSTMNLSPSLKYHSKITSSKVEAILNKKKTVIKFNYKDCSDVNVELLARAAMVPFMELELSDSKLTKNQLETFFTKIALQPEGNTTGKLDLSENDLSEVHPKIMAKAICKLNHVDLNNTNMSMDQAETLFKVILEEKKTTLYFLTVDNNLCRKKNHHLALDVAKKIDLRRKETKVELIKRMAEAQGLSEAYVAHQLKEFDVKFDREMKWLDYDSRADSSDEDLEGKNYDDFYYDSDWDDFYGDYDYEDDDEDDDSELRQTLRELWMN